MDRRLIPAIVGLVVCVLLFGGLFLLLLGHENRPHYKVKIQLGNGQSLEYWAKEEPRLVDGTYRLECELAGQVTIRQEDIISYSIQKRGVWTEKKKSSVDSVWDN